MEYVSIASIGKPFGLKGQVHALSLTSFAALRFKKGRVYTLTNKKGEAVQTVTLNHYSAKGDDLILGFKEIATPEEAGALLGFTLDLPKDEAPLPEGYVRYDEIVGYKGVDDDGKEIGTLLSVVEYSPTPNLTFKGADGKTFYVPFIDQFVGDIDHEKKIIPIHVVEGML